MKSRMERYFDSSMEPERTKKNQDLYNDIYNNKPSSAVNVLDNESEIDISKLNQLIRSREDYKKIKDYAPILRTSESLEEEKYDIYEDIDNKIYDINTILENARAKKPSNGKEDYHSLRETQFDILRNLDLNENNKEPDDEMVTDFFTEDRTMKTLIANMHNDDKELPKDEKTGDLFESLKGSENTVLTEAVKNDKQLASEIFPENTFYTSNLNFTKEDFEGFQNLQTTVKKNNKLIKVLITVLALVLIAIVAFVVYTLL